MQLFWIALGVIVLVCAGVVVWVLWVTAESLDKHYEKEILSGLEEKERRKK